MHWRHRLLTAMYAVLAACLLVAPAPARSAPAAAEDAVLVMTRNLYLGADLTPLLSATSPTDLANQASAVFAKVEATDFPARAKLLATEIQTTTPMLIGLQEVALWRTGQPGVLDGPATPATTVVYDFLQTLQAELTARGVPYTVVQAQEEFDAEVPSSRGYDIRLTLRDVILAKANLPPDALSLANPQSGRYATNLTIPTVAGPISATRGWVAVDATVHQRTFRFISTHLEAYSAVPRLAQATELILGPARTLLPVVLVGDLNSDPAEPAQQSAYAAVTRAGFVDTWARAHPNDPGFTCCNAEDLHNSTPSLTSRIDHVLTRPEVAIGEARLVGVDPASRTPAGLWPSDHAGVVTSLLVQQFKWQIHAPMITGS